MVIKGNNVHTRIGLKEVDGKYQVEEDIEYKVFGGELIVPKGFITDLASIPLQLQGVIPKRGLYDAGAILHDYLYSSQSVYPINREDSDKIFYKVMIECGVDKKTAMLFYNAVRVGGESHYQRIKDNGYVPVERVAMIDRRKEYREYEKKRDKVIRGV